MNVRRMWIGVLGAVVAAGVLAAPLHAQDDRIDGRTGREMAVYPPARHFDHQHMRLEIDIPDMEAPSFRGRMVLTVEAIGIARDVLELDAAPPPEIVVERVSVGGQETPFEHGKWPEGSRHHGTSGVLRIDLPAAVGPGESVDVEIEYTANYPAGSGDGLTWSRGDPEGENETDRHAQIHSQGQPQYNHRWFPCHDFPNERLTTELIVTVEDPYIVGSNGRLVSTRLGPPAPDGRARSTWHWLQDKPHPNYLVSLVVGRFSIVALPAGPGGMPVNEEGRKVSCYLLAPVGSERTAQAAFAKTPEMLVFFGEVFGRPYPWAKYSQALVRHFAWGGMENTSATTVREEYAWSRPGEEDGLIAHEVAHQWLGDLLTCKSWEHLWLNEGWASYSEALWAEHEASAEGPEAAREAYQRRIAGFVGSQRAMNRTTAPRFPAMVSNRYVLADENFIKPNDVYAKGAVVLHMLRKKLGDEAFFAGTRLYVDRFAYKEVETDDFRHCLEEVSGLSLERFFEQWCYRPGLPRLDVEMEWAESDGGAGAGELRVTVKQVQEIDADNPAYALSLPLRMFVGDETVVERIEIDTRQAVARFPLAARPRRVVVDPEMEVAAFTRVTKRLRAEEEAETVPAGGER